MQNIPFHRHRTPKPWPQTAQHTRDPVIQGNKEMNQLATITQPDYFVGTGVVN